MPLRRSMLAIRVARRAAAELDAFSALLSASESFSALAIPMTLWTAPRALHCLREVAPPVPVDVSGSWRGLG